MKISALPLEAILFKLRDGTNGFNAVFDQKAAEYGIKPFTLDWPDSIYSKNTSSVIFAKIPPALLAAFGVKKLNKLIIYVDSSVNQNLEKPHSFSGLVSVALDFDIQWKTTNMDQLLEPYGLALEDTLAEIFQLLTVQNWGAGVTYNGAFAVPRGIIEVPVEGEGSLRQSIGFRMSFQVSV